MKVSLVAAGILFTLVGLVTLVVPSVPFICIGALIFGPIMLIQGLLAKDRSRPAYPPQAPVNVPWYPPVQAGPAAAPEGQAGAPPRTCPSCGNLVTSIARFCTRCGAALPGST